MKEYLIKRLLTTIPTILGVTVLVFVFSNLVVDVLYAVLDLRISYGRKRAH